MYPALNRQLSATKKHLNKSNLCLVPAYIKICIFDWNPYAYRRMDGTMVTHSSRLIVNVKASAHIYITVLMITPTLRLSLRHTTAHHIGNWSVGYTTDWEVGQRARTGEPATGLIEYKR